MPRGGHECGHRMQTKDEAKLVGNDGLGEERDETASKFHLINVGTQSSKPVTLEVSANEKPLEMEIDTGAALSILNLGGKEEEGFPDRKNTSMSLL